MGAYWFQYVFTYGNGDSYYGDLLDDGSYGYYVGYTEESVDEHGLVGTYTITGGSFLENYSGQSGEIWTDLYYDAATGRSVTPDNYASGHSSGLDGLGSEFDSLDGGYDEFGYGYYEADARPEGPTYFYYFYFTYGNGDYYYGTVYDNGEYGYEVGQTWSVTDENGNVGSYVIYGVDELTFDWFAYSGIVYLQYYYDVGTGRLFYTEQVPQSYYYGQDGIGSEEGYIDTTDGFFGHGFYEASGEVPTTTIYYFIFVYSNGDYYYGYVYDDGSAGLAVDTYRSYYDYSGNFSYYYIYSAEDIGYHPELLGSINVTSYYDSESGTLNTPQMLETYGGLGAEKGTLGSEFGVFGHGGYYEADVPTGTSQVFFYFVYASGDYYFGYTWDDGSYGYQVGQTWGGIDENGGFSYYYVYDVVDQSADPGIAGLVTVNAYFDADETGQWYVPEGYAYYYASGLAGIGSEYDSIGSWASYFGQGYYEADFSRAETAYYFKFEYGNGDFYFGVVYGNPAAGLAVGQSWTTVDENGQTGTYTIYQFGRLGFDAGLDGAVYVYYYFDSESASAWTPDLYAAGVAAGSAGLGSEFDTIAAGADGFGLGFYEADAVADTAYYFYYSYGNGDFYYGVAYDDGGYGYAVGQSWTTVNATGQTGSYVIYDALADASHGAAGMVSVSVYYDAESASYYQPDLYAAGYPTGLSGLGSEGDFIAGSLFGYGFYEADALSETAFFFSYSYGGGDVYWGVAYDDGNLGYVVGQSWTTVDEHGLEGTYLIYDATGLGMNLGLTGLVAVYAYYDADGAAIHTPDNYLSGLASGSGGLGSEADYVGGHADFFGYGFYEADVV